MRQTESNILFRKLECTTVARARELNEIFHSKNRSNSTSRDFRHTCAINIIAINTRCAFTKSIFPPLENQYPSGKIFYSPYWIYLTTKSHILFNSGTLYEISDVMYKNTRGTVFVEVISIYCPNVRPKQISLCRLQTRNYPYLSRNINIMRTIYSTSRVRHR